MEASARWTRRYVLGEGGSFLEEETSSWGRILATGRLLEEVARFWRRRQALGGEYLRQALRGGEWLMEASVRWRRRYALGEGRLLEKVAGSWRRRRQALGGGCRLLMSDYYNGLTPI